MNTLGFFLKELHELKISEIKTSLEKTKSKLDTIENRSVNLKHYQQKLPDTGKKKKRMKEMNKA